MAFSNRPMRRSALIGPWGVGAIVPFPNDESLMIAGLDMWRYNDAQPFVIKDERLTKRLGVSELRWPPDFREKNADSENCNLKIPAVRFPTWYYCPFCGSMKKTTYYEPQPECDNYPWKDGRVCSANGKFKRKMIPERFVVVCPEGHISDFPIANWSMYRGMLMRYRIEYADGRCCNFANSRKDLLEWLKLLRDEEITDIRKIYKNGVTDGFDVVFINGRIALTDHAEIPVFFVVLADPLLVGKWDLGVGNHGG